MAQAVGGGAPEAGQGSRQRRRSPPLGHAGCLVPAAVGPAGGRATAMELGFCFFGKFRMSLKQPKEIESRGTFEASPVSSWLAAACPNPLPEVPGPQAPGFGSPLTSSQLLNRAFLGFPTGPVTICGEATILHGGFLLASRLCHPKPLSELTKSDWDKVGKPIIDALREVCTSYSTYPPQPSAWKKKAAVVLWSKILLSDASSPSANQRWKEDVFFSVSNMIPDVNHTILFELFKAVNAPRLFAQLLLVLPEHVCQKELETFVEYIANETTPEDVSFFLDVWWEILKHKDGQEDRVTLLFGVFSRQHLSDADEPPHVLKRFKSDAPESPVIVGLLRALMEGLKLIKESVGPAKVKCYALANLADVLSLLVPAEGEPASLPAQVYLDKISSVVTLWSRDLQNRYNKRGLDEKVKEAERSVSLLNMATPGSSPLAGHLGFLRSLLDEWSVELQGLLGNPQEISYESYRFLDSLDSLGKKLTGCAKLGDLDKEMALEMLELGDLIANFLKRVSPQVRGKNSDSGLMASVAMVIIEQKMERHEEMCSIFASEKSWASSKDWAACLTKNKELFQKPELVLKLLETAASLGPVADSAESREEQVKTAKVILECYTELSLPDKNAVISGVLSRWGRQGLSGILKPFAEGFPEELNIAFNQIIQSASGEGFKKVVNSVSRLAVLNPEATVKKICNLAVANLGTHQFLAEILCSFPALNFEEPHGQDESISLVLGCLKETVMDKLSSAKEKEQFLEFLVRLMQPSGDNPLLAPAKVTQNLIIPFLKSDFPHLELCLQILDVALKVPLASDQHWIHTCHPFPLVFCLCKLLHEFTRYWHELQGRHGYSLETKDAVTGNLAQLCDILSVQKDGVSPELWTQSVAWLHKKADALDWTIGLRLKKVYGEHFKNEVPATLFEVCKLPEDEWTSRSLPTYGLGSGLLAWLECCCVSTALREQMLVLLKVNMDNPEEVNLFSKGFLLALVQVFPWCSQSEWRRLIHVIKSLLEREVLYVPYSLEYVHHLPLLNFQPFAYHLQFSVLLLRGFQFLCSSSGATWLPVEAWKHVARLYCLSLSDLLDSVKSNACCQWRPTEGKSVARELSFVYIQMFCHTLHVAAMLPEGTGEPLLFLSLEILSQYQMLCDADESLGRALRKANEKHFLESIAENVTNKELRTMLQQKLSKL
ncbi:gem-associated protein 4 [Heteronotia binoei]|uniref:gem-associated protein 4 n=1 Tax=Heteronotia binoei TaxID=13085 RepID=UPI00292F8B34|nr:gem-associated protein 4 [Heteronotia binoei]